MHYTDKEVLQKALIALESCSGAPHWEELQSTVTALKQALAKQPMRRVGVVEPLMGTMRTVIWDEGMIPLAGTTLWAKDE